MPLEPLVFFTDRDLGNRFPDILADSGLDVRRHRDLFSPDCPDEVWLEAVAKENWIAVSHDARIRYKPNERAAVVKHKARLLVVVGKAPYPELAESFVATVPTIAAFVAHHTAPWIAKVYRQTQSGKPMEPRPGAVALWFPVLPATRPRTS